MTRDTEKARAAAATANTGNIPSGLENRRNTTKTTSRPRPVAPDPRRYKHAPLTETHRGVECLCGHFIPTRNPDGARRAARTRALEWCSDCLFLWNLDRMFPADQEENGRG